MHHCTCDPKHLDIGGTDPECLVHGETNADIGQEDVHGLRTDESLHAEEVAERRANRG